MITNTKKGGKQEMSKIFDYMEFNDDSFVFAQDKYTKETALERAKEETDVFDDYTIDDIKENYVAFRFNPHYCQSEFGSNGYYTFVKKRAIGSFAVWVIG